MRTTLWGWGANNGAQLTGASPTSGQPSPVQVTNLNDITAVAAGERHVLALRMDGTVWAWGNNDHGQLGDGTTIDRTSPVQVSGLQEIRRIAAGANHSLAVTKDNRVMAWGDNDRGQLGDGTTADRSSPTQIGALTSIAAVFGGVRHSMALKYDLTVWAWGANDRGQLGDATTTDRSSPVQVSGLTNVIELAAGAEHNLALKTDQSVWAWGDNSKLQTGALGPGPLVTNPPAMVSSPFQVLGGVSTSGDALAAGRQHSLVRKADGTIAAWGSNDDQEIDPALGDPITLGPTGLSTPVNVRGLWAGGDHSLAATTDRKAWTWGSNSDGQLGASSQPPVEVPNIAGALQMAGGRAYTLALATGVPGVSPASLTFPSQRARTTSTAQTITMTNVGSGPLTICGLGTAGEFTQTNTCPQRPSTMQPGATCAIQVSFQPTSSGVKSGSVTVGGAGSGNSATVSLQGTATAPKATFNPTSHNFGNQAWGTPSPVRQVTLSNLGDADLVISQIATSGDFSQTNNCPSSLPPDPTQFCVIDVVFNPQDVGPRTGALRVVDDLGVEYAMSLSGTGTGPSASVSPLGVDFGNQPAGVKTNVKTVTLTNVGTASLSVGTVKLGGTTPGDFTIEVDGCGGKSLAPNAQCAIDLTFTPSGQGAIDAELSVATNAPFSPHAVSLKGTGT